MGPRALSVIHVIGSPNIPTPPPKQPAPNNMEPLALYRPLPFLKRHFQDLCLFGRVYLDLSCKMWNRASVSPPLRDGMRKWPDSETQLLRCFYGQGAPRHLIKTLIQSLGLTGAEEVVLPVPARCLHRVLPTSPASTLRAGARAPKYLRCYRPCPCFLGPN